MLEIRADEKAERELTVKRYWQETESDVDDTRSRGERAFDFYKSKQWNADDIAILDAESRPHITYNFIKTPIRNTCGYQRQNRQAIKVLQRRGGLGSLAEFFTEAMRYIEDVSEAVYAEAFAFFYGLIGGQGYIGLDISYDDEPLNGDLLIQNEDPDAIRCDPYNKEYDINKGRYVFREAWKTKDELEALFPDVDFTNMSFVDGDNVKTSRGEHYQDNKGTSANMATLENIYRIKECWWHTWERFVIFINTQTLEVTQIPFKDKKKATEFRARLEAELQPFSEVSRVISLLNLTTMLGDKAIQDSKDPFNGVKRYPICRFVPDFINGYIKGEVEDLEEPQEDSNKRFSQVLHHLNQSANSGWIADEDALGTGQCTTWEELKDGTSKPGFLIIKKKGSSLEKITPTPLSEGHIRLAEQGPELIKRISGANADLMGERSDPNMSGKALERRVIQGQVTTEVIHDNWRFTKKILGETILEFIRKVDILSFEEVIAILKDSNITGEDGQPIDPWVIYDQMKDRAKGKYGVVVSLSQASTTSKLDNYYALTDLAKAGVQIPPEVLIEESLISEASKEKIRKMASVQPNPVNSGGMGQGGPVPQ